MFTGEPISLGLRRLRSAVLGNERDVWLQPPAMSSPEASLAVFLDGEYYVGLLGAPGTLDALQREGAMPPHWIAYVAGREREVRWPESFCNPDFARFVCDELVPEVEATTGASRERLLVGLSLTGLSAAHVALSRPEVFTRVLCHSGSFWWERGALSRTVEPASSPMRFRLTVGDGETKTNVDHGHGLVQVDSQIEGVRQMRDALVENDYAVSYSEYAGGHDAASWRRELPDDLRALFV